MNCLSHVRLFFFLLLLSLLLLLLLLLLLFWDKGMDDDSCNCRVEEL